MTSPCSAARGQQHVGPALPARSGPTADDKLTGKVAVKHPWYPLPEALGLAELIGIRDTLRRENLFDTSRLPAVDPVQPPPYDKSYLTARTADGTYNDLDHPGMGMAGPASGATCRSSTPGPTEDRILEPNPREVSRKLMTRETFTPPQGSTP